jgi:hypothetical protein
VDTRRNFRGFCFSAEAEEEGAEDDRLLRAPITLVTEGAATTAGEAEGAGAGEGAGEAAGEGEAEAEGAGAGEAEAVGLDVASPLRISCRLFM